jgi:hypothetical protein
MPRDFTGPALSRISSGNVEERKAGESWSDPEQSIEMGCVSGFGR